MENTQIFSNESGEAQTNIATYEDPHKNSKSHQQSSPNMPTSNTFHGPYQDDSTLTVLLNLRTAPARFLIWINIPFCWFVGIAIATRHIEHWLDAHFSGSKSTVAVVFVVAYVVYTILAHTAGVFGGLACELWWNPYARAPTLRGEVGREEEVAMVKHNRLMARRIFRSFVPWGA